MLLGLCLFQVELINDHGTAPRNNGRGLFDYIQIATIWWPFAFANGRFDQATDEGSGEQPIPRSLLLSICGELAWRSMSTALPKETNAISERLGAPKQ